MVNRKLYRSPIPEGEHYALLRVYRGMVNQDAEHHGIELGDQIRLCGQRLEEFAEHSLSAFPFGDLIFKLIMALLQRGVPFSQPIEVG